MISSILKRDGLKGIPSAIRRFIYWHNLSDLVDDIVSLFGIKEVEIDVLWGRMVVDLSDRGISRDLFHNRFREPECVGVYLHELRRGDIVLDVGANIGYYVLAAGKKAGRIYAIEPDPRNIELLRKNVRLNNLWSKTKISQVAFGDIEGIILFDLGEHYNISKVATDGTGIPVPITTVDAYIEAEGDRIDYIRMDVEGYEYRILLGAKKTIRKNHPKLFVEVHPPQMGHYGGSVWNFYEFLAKEGYTLKYLSITLDRKNFFEKPPIKLTRKDWKPPEVVFYIDESLGRLKTEELRFLFSGEGYHIFLE